MNRRNLSDEMIEERKDSYGVFLSLFLVLFSFFFFHFSIHLKTRLKSLKFVSWNPFNSYFLLHKNAKRLTLCFASDVDECKQGNHQCKGTGQKCVNIQGSYECQCEEGYLKSGANNCKLGRLEYRWKLNGLNTKHKAPSTRIRRFLYPQMFLCGYKNICVHT